MRKNLTWFANQPILYWPELPMQRLIIFDQLIYAYVENRRIWDWSPGKISPQ